MLERADKNTWQRTAVARNQDLLLDRLRIVTAQWVRARLRYAALYTQEPPNTALLKQALHSLKRLEEQRTILRFALER